MRIRNQSPGFRLTEYLSPSLLYLMVEGVDAVQEYAGDVAVGGEDSPEADEAGLQAVRLIDLHHQQPLQGLLHHMPLVRAGQPRQTIWGSCVSKKSIPV